MGKAYNFSQVSPYQGIFSSISYQGIYFHISSFKACDKEYLCSIILLFLFS